VHRQNYDLPRNQSDRSAASFAFLSVSNWFHAAPAEASVRIVCPVLLLSSRFALGESCLAATTSDIDSPDRSSLTSFSFAPRTDVYEEDDRIVLEMEVPGMREEDVRLTLEGNTLSISGERKIENNRKPDRYQRVERYYGSFSRTFTLPATVDPDSVDAKYQHGILHVSMAKKANARPRQIKVNGGAKQLTANAA
jgi:HSP20 family protein